ncbi:MAG: hypothetical protein KGY60_10730 [Bacteroidales bacterium]|nr:hypothetical protein [Bacteroidales bacterium]
MNFAKTKSKKGRQDQIGISPTLFKIIKATLDEAYEGILKARDQNPNRKVNGEANGIVDRKYWDWDVCIPVAVFS